MMFVDVSLRMRVEKPEARLAELESRFTEPQPACKQNQEYMLEKLGRGWVDTNKLDPKDKIKLIKNPQDKIPSLREYYNVPDEQQELDRDAKLWDAVQDYEETE